MMQQRLIREELVEAGRLYNGARHQVDKEQLSRIRGRYKVPAGGLPAICGVTVYFLVGDDRGDTCRRCNKRSGIHVAAQVSTSTKKRRPVGDDGP